jgi:hypothetical protein
MPIQFTSLVEKPNLKLMSKYSDQSSPLSSTTILSINNHIEQ